MQFAGAVIQRTHPGQVLLLKLSDLASANMTQFKRFGGFAITVISLLVAPHVGDKKISHALLIVAAGSLGIALFFLGRSSCGWAWTRGVGGPTPLGDTARPTATNTYVEKNYGPIYMTVNESGAGGTGPSGNYEYEPNLRKDTQDEDQ
jgi:hypothetical protein